MFRIWHRALFSTLLVGFKLEGCAVGVSAIELYVAEHHIHLSSRCPVEDGGPGLWRPWLYAPLEERASPDES